MATCTEVELLQFCVTKAASLHGLSIRFGMFYMVNNGGNNILLSDRNSRDTRVQAQTIRARKHYVENERKLKKTTLRDSVTRFATPCMTQTHLQYISIDSLGLYEIFL